MKLHNQGVERDAKISGGLIGQRFGRAPHPKSLGNNTLFLGDLYVYPKWHHL